ncbi:hypothetical protein M413DRAFT_28893 [Hebeloma cylindrosporum]|uniref:Uncharacterized protein n=1 Tax=Hebeloma cylindrosporum TaxID=76867 RepID=A0A0C3BSQ4_HEBCY|nr:hypothetical protein M413DRAFT_28893 [Hebeloma cylindrosporum h7]
MDQVLSPTYEVTVFADAEEEATFMSHFLYILSCIETHPGRFKSRRRNLHCVARLILLLDNIIDTLDLVNLTVEHLLNTSMLYPGIQTILTEYRHAYELPRGIFPNTTSQPPTFQQFRALEVLVRSTAAAFCAAHNREVTGFTLMQADSILCRALAG